MLSKVLKVLSKVKRLSFLGYDPQANNFCLGEKYNKVGDEFTYIMEAGFVEETDAKHSRVQRYQQWKLTQKGIDFVDNPPDTLPDLYTEEEEVVVAQMPGESVDLDDGYVHEVGLDPDYIIQTAYVDAFIKLMTQQGIDEAVFSRKGVYVIMTGSQEVANYAANQDAQPTILSPSGGHVGLEGKSSNPPVDLPQSLLPSSPSVSDLPTGKSQDQDNSVLTSPPPPFSSQ